MNKKVAAAVAGGFVGGALVGFGGGSIFWKKKYEKKADAEIAEVKARLKKKQADEKREEKGEPEGQAVEEEKEDPISEEEKEAHQERLKHQMFATLYSGGGPSEDDDYHLTEDERLAMAGFKRTREQAKNKWKPPKLIPEETCGEDGFDIADLEFYMGDQQLAYEDGTIVDNPTDIVGVELYRFNFATNDECCVVVRNYARETDYRVTKVWSNYADCY